MTASRVLPEKAEKGQEQRLRERPTARGGPSARPGKRRCLCLNPQRMTAAILDLVALDRRMKSKVISTSKSKGIWRFQADL